MTAEPAVSPEAFEPTGRAKPRPLDSLTAASSRLTTKNIDRFAKSKRATAEDWQAEARSMYHLIGELRFLANLIANRVGQARLHVARLSDDPTADPEPVSVQTEDLPDGVEPPSEDDLKAYAAWQSIGQKPQQLAQMVTRAAVNLFVPGDGYFVGTPPAVEAELNPRPEVVGTLVQAPVAAVTEPGPEELDLTTLTWRYLSTAEVSFDSSSNDVTLQVGDSEKGTWKGAPERVLMFRCWRPDPFEWWTADSPTRSSLPVLRELVGLTMAVSAQVDSRLAGAGIFLVPQSAKDAVMAAAGPQEEGQDDDPFTEAIMEAMLTPISDRSNASALVPLILTVPDETIEKFKHLKFSSDLDSQYQALRQEALLRFALGADAPPEALTGVGGMNHWGAWIVKEDTVTTHVEPPTAVVCDAWTTQFLWPVLEAAGMDPETAHRYVIWYSVEHLIVRPNRFDDALKAYGAGELNGTALRAYGGFDDDDAPDSSIENQAIVLVLDMLKQAPSLAQTPGIPVLVQQITEVLNGQAPPVTEAAPPAEGGAAQGPPATAVAASGRVAPDWSMPGVTDENLVEALEQVAREAHEDGGVWDSVSGKRVQVP
jgi:hypothetical protein